MLNFILLSIVFVLFLQFCLIIRERKKVNNLFSFNNTNQANFYTIKQTNIQLGEHVMNLESKLRNINRRLGDLETIEVDNMNYVQASKLLDKGLDYNDVANTCHIASAEAKLLQSLKFHSN